jgi:hypothetical protein
LYITKAEKDAMKEAKDFNYRISLEIKEEMAHVEKYLKKKRKRITKEQIEEKYKGWILNSSFSKTRDTKNFLIGRDYWLDKYFIA